MNRRAGIKRCLGECLVPRWNFTPAVAIDDGAGAEGFFILGDERIDQAFLQAESNAPTHEVRNDLN